MLAGSLLWFRAVRLQRLLFKRSSYYRRQFLWGRQRSLSLEPLEDRSLLASFTDSGAQLNITLSANENLAIVSNGASYAFSSNQSLTNGGVAQSADFSAIGGTSVTLLAPGLARYTTINIVDGSSASNSTVRFNSSGVNAYSDNFIVVLDHPSAGTITFSGTSSFNGSNSLSASTSRNVAIASGANVSVVNGNLTLSANQQATATNGDFIGISVNGTLTTNGTGSIQLAGKGGNDPSTDLHIGINISSTGGLIRSTAAAANAGTITLLGQGGAGTTDNDGVVVQSSGQVVTSSGSIQINGTGGNGTTTLNRGVVVLNGGQVSSTGTGAAAANITIFGTGGSGTNSNIGVDIFGTNTQVSVVDGDLFISGQISPLATGATNFGVRVQSNSQVRSTGTGASAGNITLLSGTGSEMFMEATAIINAAAGTVTIGSGRLTANGVITGKTIVADTATLGGTGTVSNASTVTVQSGGTVRPGLSLSPRRLNAGSISFASGSTFSVEVNGTTAGSTYDQLNVTGTVSLGGSTLARNGTISTAPGSDIVLITNDGTDQVTGTFSGLSEGSLVEINGVKFFITYIGGTGNDVVLESPDLGLTSVQLVQAVTPFNPTNPVVGEEVFVKVSYTTRNLPASANYRLEAKLDGVPISITRTNGAGLTSSNWTWIWGGWFASPGPHTVEVKLDADNSVAEVNETNNTLAPAIMFTPAAPITLPQPFVHPMGGVLFHDWSFVNYYDVDVTSGIEDYQGGPYAYDGHNGHDITLPNFARMDAGIPLYAAADGTVESVADGNFDRNTASGSQPSNFIVINHGNGWKTEYVHLAANTVTVKVGQVVSGGQLLGLAGSSGSSTDAHLHFAVLHNGTLVETQYDPATYYVNPLPYQSDEPTTILDSGITNFTPSTAEYKERPADHSVFSTLTPKNVTLWFKASHFNQGDSYQVKWYRPSGTLNSTSSFTASSELRYQTHQWTLSSSALASFPGTWRVTVEMGGVELVNRIFEATTGPGIAGMKAANGSSPIGDNRTTAWDFGSATVAGAAVSQTFTITNHGTADLSLSNLVLPPGFALNGPFPTLIAAGSTASLTVDLTTTEAGSKFGAIQVTTNDPDTPTFNFNVSGTVTGAGPAGAPVIGLPGAALAYTTLGQASVIDPSATVVDANSADLGGGQLTVEFAYVSSLQDSLAIQNVGNGAGQIGVSGSEVTFDGAIIGTFSGGGGGTPLIVNLQAGATLSTVQALVRNVTFSTTATDPETLARYVRFKLIDDTGNTSNQPFTAVIQNLRPTTLQLDGGDLVIADSSRAGKADQWRLELSGSDLQFTDVTGNTVDVSSIPGASGDATTLVTVPASTLSGISRLVLDMREGVDALTIDVFNGNPLPAGGMLLMGDAPLSRGDQLTVSGGTVGTVTYTVDPATNRFVGLSEGSAIAFGSTTLIVTYHGGDGNDVAFVPNDPPTAAAGGPYLALEGGNVQLNGSGSDSYQLGTSLTYEWDLDGDGIFGESGLSGQRGDETGPAPTFVAAALDGPSFYTVTFRVTDNGGLSADSEATIEITNADPVIHGVFNNGPEDEAQSVTIIITANDAAGSDDPLSYEFDYDDDGIYEVGLQDSNSASHTFADNGSYRVNVRVTDGDGGAATSFTYVTVNNVAPTARDNAYSTSPAVAISGNVVLNDTGEGWDSDPAGAHDPLTVSSDTLPAHGTLVLHDDGSFTYTPDSTFAGTDGFTYTISDGDGGTDTATVTITVVPAPAGTILTIADTCLGGTALLISGTIASDTIVVEPGSTSTTLKVTLNGVSSTVDKPSGRIIVAGGDGDDNIQIAGALASAVWLYGEAGDDRLNAGSGGGLLIGGDGNDELLGGNGRDVMIGGLGADRLIGNANDDILVAGLTTRDSRSSAGHEKFWCEVLAEWHSSLDFTDRVNNLRGSNPAYTGAKLMLEVVDDCFSDEIDFLNGSSGDDWLIFLAGEDKVVGQTEAGN